MEANKSFFGYKAALGAFLVMFVNLGACTTLGIFVTYLADYSGWPLGVVGYIGTVNTIGNVILSIIAIKALGKIGAKWTMLISVLACAAHVHFYTFATPGQTMPSLICYYMGGFLASFAITFGTHAVCSTVIADWFIEKREKITGIVFSGAGFGAAIWVFFAGQLFKYFDFKNCYRILSVFILGIGLIAVFLFIKDPKQMGQKPLGADSSKNDGTPGGAVEIPGVTKAEAMKSASFWVLAAALLCVCMAGSAFMAYSPAWWQMNGLDSTQSANWNAVYLVLSGFVLLAVGSVFTKTGPSLFSIIVCLAYMGCMGCMIALGSNPSTMILAFIVFFGALAYPLNASIPGLIGQSVFGGKHFGAISATLMTAVYVGQMFYAPIMSAFLASEGGMASGWLFFGGAVVVGMLLIVLSIFLSPMKRIGKAGAK